MRQRQVPNVNVLLPERQGEEQKKLSGALSAEDDSSWTKPEKARGGPSGHSYDSARDGGVRERRAADTETEGQTDTGGVREKSPAQPKTEEADTLGKCCVQSYQRALTGQCLVLQKRGARQKK